MLKDIIDAHGLSRHQVSQACGVHHSTVEYWCEVGLPSRPGDRAKRARYERQIAKLCGMPVGWLRAKLKGGEYE